MKICSFNTGQFFRSVDDFTMSGTVTLLNVIFTIFFLENDDFEIKFYSSVNFHHLTALDIIFNDLKP